MMKLSTLPQIKNLNENTTCSNDSDMDNKEGEIKGRERFGGYSREFIVRTLENYNRLEDESLQRGDYKLAASISGMSIDFLNTVLNRKKDN